MSSLFASNLRERLLTLELHDPDSRNALSLSAARELRTLIAAGGFDALVMTAKGRVFCSGGQLADYAAMPTADQGRAVNDEIRDVLGELARLNVPTIVCVSGDAFGGGVELISCFDVVLTAPHVMLALWQRKIGLSFGWGSGARLEDRIGRAQLKRLSLSTAALSAREALSIGLVDQVVPESSLTARALELAARLTSLPNEPVTVFKNFDRATEAKSFNSVWWNPSHRQVLDSRKR